MANFEIPDNPEFNEALRKLEASDPATADLFNSMFARLMENEAALRGNKTPIVNAKTLDGHGAVYFSKATHQHDAEEIGLGNVDNTADANKPVSTAQQTAIDTAKTEAKSYTDTKIANLINGAPSTLDTLKEIADAMAESEDVVEALDAAVGNKSDKGHKHTKSEITDFPSTMTPSAHNQAASTITAGTLGGKVNANATAQATLTTAQLRDAVILESDPGEGATVTYSPGTIVFSK